MIRTTVTTTFPRMPNMEAVTAVVARQAIASAPVQRAFARSIAEPPKANKRSPVRWESERQRRFVMATVNLPYQRTGGLTDKWKLVAISTGRGATIVLGNPAPMARYVHGTARGRDQQRFLRDNGWLSTPEIRAAVFPIVIQQMRARFPGKLSEEMSTGRAS